MDKERVLEILTEISLLLELKGENPFKSRAYTSAVRSLETFDGDLKEMVGSNRLAELPGLGDAIVKKVTELVTTGRLEYYEKLKGEFPEELLELMNLQGLGPKKIKILHDQLKITNITELETACRAHLVQKLTGFGVKTEEKILASIEQNRQYANRFRYAEAWAIAHEIREDLRQHPAIGEVSVAGSLRRGKEIIKDLDFVASSSDPASVMDYFITMPGVVRVTNHGTTKSSVLLEGGMSADLRVVNQTQYPYALHHFTGSKEHNVAMRQRAIAQGKKLSEWGLFKQITGPNGEKMDGELVPCQTEGELFAALGLQEIPPELREDMGEIVAAEKNAIPRLMQWTQLKGIFHNHSNWSDGQNSLVQMIEEARELGWEYLGMSDHSKSSFQANGLNETRLMDQMAQIKKWNAENPGFHVFTGSEVDILKDGQLDFSDEVMSQLDFVVASVHNSMNLDEATMTARVIKAMENRYVTMLGHVTGRLLLQREPYAINLEKIIDCAAVTGTWIELNCSSWRMDMDWRWWHKARDKGVLCSINPDAHRVDHYGMVRHGATIARKGWLRTEDIVNTRPLAEVEKLLKVKRNL